MLFLIFRHFFSRCYIFFLTLCLSTVSACLPPILVVWGSFQSQILKRWGSGKKMSASGGLKYFLSWIFAFGVYYVSCPKKRLKIRYNSEGAISNFKCWSWPVLAKQPINVQFWDILAPLNHLNNVAKN